VNGDELINRLKIRLTESQAFGGQLSDGPREVAKRQWDEFCAVAKEYYILNKCWPAGDIGTEFKIIENQFQDIQDLANTLSSRIKEANKNSTMKMIVDKSYEINQTEPCDRHLVTEAITPAHLRPEWFWLMPEVLEKTAEMMIELKRRTAEIKMDEAKKGLKTFGGIHDHTLELVFMTGGVLVRNGAPKTYALPIAQVIHGWAMGDDDKASAGWGTAAYKDAKKLWKTRLVNILPRK
jgi:hypothetical protein